MKLPTPSLARWLLAFACFGSGCLNPRPEDFPSGRAVSDGPVGQDDGEGDGMSVAPDPNVPSTGEPPGDLPDTPGIIVDGSDAGLPPADAAAPDAEAGNAAD